MRSKNLMVAVAVCFLSAVVGPALSFAAQMPTTKKQCLKHKNMKWDAASKHCMNK